MTCIHNSSDPLFCRKCLRNEEKRNKKPIPVESSVSIKKKTSSILRQKPCVVRRFCKVHKSVWLVEYQWCLRASWEVAAMRETDPCEEEYIEMEE